MQDQGYNGWKNYETWAVGLFLDGNYTGEGTYREVLSLVEEIDRENGALSPGEITWRVAEALKDYTEDQLAIGDAITGLAGDLLGGALSDVDWHELAENKLSEVAES